MTNAPRKPPDPDDARGDAERTAAAKHIADQLEKRGVFLNRRESGAQLVAIMEAVERFELAVESRGGDLMVDEGPHGVTTEPDDPRFVLPRRTRMESVYDYLCRLAEATHALRRRK